MCTAQHDSEAGCSTAQPSIIHMQAPAAMQSSKAVCIELRSFLCKQLLLSFRLKLPHLLPSPVCLLGQCRVFLQLVTNSVAGQGGLVPVKLILGHGLSVDQAAAAAAAATGIRSINSELQMEAMLI
jgi:hypothetical protein